MSAPYFQRKKLPIIKVMTREIVPMANTVPAISGFCGNAPLPPLNGVLFVTRSRPLLKSRYSFSVLTLMWASNAPSSASTSKNRLMSTCFAITVLRPRNTQTGVRIRKGALIDWMTVFNFIVVTFSAMYAGCANVILLCGTL